MKWTPRYRWKWLVWSLGLTFIFTTLVAVPVSYLLIPHAIRWEYLDHLTSSQSQLREQAIHYVIRNAKVDARVRNGAIARLSLADEAAFMDIVWALDQAGVWSRKFISEEQWLRWVKVMAQDPDLEGRILAVQALADLGDLANRPSVWSILNNLLVDPEADVRLNALSAAAELWGQARQRSAYEGFFLKAANDSQPAIARQAWIFMSLVNPASPPAQTQPVDAAGLPYPLAMARWWALLKIDRQAIDAATEKCLDQTVNPAERAAIVYALKNSSSQPAVQQVFTRLLEADPKTITTETQAIYWRAILAGPKPSADSNSPWRQALARFCDQADPANPLHQPLILAAAFRLGQPGIQTSKSANNAADADWQALVDLAALEAVSANPYTGPIPADAPPLLRLAKVKAQAHPNPNDLRPLFVLPQSSLRDLACLVAASHFTREQNSKLVWALLGGDLEDNIHFDDRAKCAGAILAGLTGLQPNLLAQKAQVEDVPQVREIMRLGLAMQSPNTAPNIPKLIQSSLIVPEMAEHRTSLLLGLLHMGRREALDYLLNPRGQQTINLIELLDTLRWWPVLAHYLPSDAPEFWVWADPNLQQFQLEQLRSWYLLNLHRADLLKPAPGAASASQAAPR